MMQKPKQLELKEWLCDNSVKGLIVHFYQTGTESADTDWELIPENGKPKRVKASSVNGLVDIRPDWARVLSVKPAVKREVFEYRDFTKENARELAEYDRLKEKFG